VFFATLVWDQEVEGSNPFAPTTSKGSGPDTWVTLRTGYVSNEDGRVNRDFQSCGGSETPSRAQVHWVRDD